MKLLIITQALDTTDPTLSTYVRWVEEIGARFEHTEVICLKEGVHSLPANFTVHSLGKEEGVGRATYVARLYRHAWTRRHEYDAVFVHMNQEYILLAGLMWKLLRKPVYFWRNHYSGSFFTDLAILLSTRVFCTSVHSYTAQFSKTQLMPVGVDLSRFQLSPLPRAPQSILFFARIAPSKRPEMFIDALGAVLAKGVSFIAGMYGSPLEEDASYYESLKARAEAAELKDRLQFHAGVPNELSKEVYQSYDIFVNCSPSGMFDKTLFEAAACGCRVIAASDDFHAAAGDESYAPDVDTLTERLIEALEADEDQITRQRIHMQTLARGESLGTLADLLSQEIQGQVH